MKNIKVRKNIDIQSNDVTDISLLIKTNIKEEITEWDRNKIINALVNESNLEKNVAEEISEQVESKVKELNLTYVNSSLIREIVDNYLLEKGLFKKHKKQKLIGIPKHDLYNFIYNKNLENSNISSHNPEMINLQISETILKQFALEEVFSEEVSKSHLEAKIHIHDLGYPTRFYCSAHSLEFIKKRGLDLDSMLIKSSPAKYARTLTGHLNTFLSSIQAYYAGALGIGFLNIMYAPLLRGLSKEQLRDEARYLIFSCAQNCFSRGSQTLFTDFNLHTGIPDYLREVPVIGPKGKYYAYKENVGEYFTKKAILLENEYDYIMTTEEKKCPEGYKFFKYKDFEQESQDFLNAIINVFKEGDMYGHLFPFPKGDYHIDNNTFEDPKQLKLLENICEVASKNGSPYFIFDRDKGGSLSQCCRLKQKITDISMIENPENLRFCGFGNITINLPQCAYRSNRNIEKAFKEIDKCISLSIKAHLQKRKFLKTLLNKNNSPLWQISKLIYDNKPYVDIDEATYIIGIIGLDEFVHFMTGKQLHECKDSYKLGMKVISHMFLNLQERKKEYNLKFTLEESPAESASKRLAKIDFRNFECAKEVIKGNKELGEVYYVNSVHYAPDAPITAIERIVGQSKFHQLIESGAIVHCFVGEKLPSKESILNLLKKVFYNTKCSQLTISPTFNVCEECHNIWV